MHLNIPHHTHKLNLGLATDDKLCILKIAVHEERH